MRQLLILSCILLSILPFAFSGKAVLAGGNTASNNAEIYEAFISQSSPGGRKPYIGVITAANTWSTAKSVANSIISRLRNTYGVDNIEWLPFHKDNGNICTGTSLNSKIRSMTGLYFNGGTTKWLFDCFKRNGVTSSALSLIKSRFNSDDLAIFASSAAALAFQSTPVIADSRESWSTLANGPSQTASSGFGLFTGGFIDVHTAERGRQGRLMRFVYDKRSSSTYGFGIDENAAMVLNGNSFKVAGWGGVAVINVGSASRSDTNKRYGLRNVKLTYLTNGDIFYLSSRNSAFASYKKSSLTSTRATTSSNIFGSNNFKTVTTNLARSSSSSTTYGLTSQTRPRYRLDFGRPTSRVRGTKSGRTYTSWRNMNVNLYCSSGC